MGIFGKSKKGNADAADAQETAAPPKKKGLFGSKGAKPSKPVKGKKKKGKKANLTHIELMGLNESVADAVYSEVAEEANQPDTAVRSTETEFIIVAITNDMFIEADVDKDDENFGAFASALEQSTIRSVTLAEDLGKGVIGIIPDRQTLEALDEYDFATDFQYRWALLDTNIQDDGSLVLLSNGPTLGELFSLSADQNFNVLIAEDDDGVYASIVNEAEADDVAAEPDDSEDDDYVVAPEPTPSTTYADDEFADPGDSPNDFEDEDFDEEPDESDTASGAFHDFDDVESSGEDDFPEDELDWSTGDDAVYQPQNTQDEFDVYSEVTPEDARDAIHRVTEHAFTNSELSLSIDTSRFDEYFDRVEPKQFDLSMVRNPDDQLERLILNMRSEANTEMARYHDDAVASLRASFISRLRRTYDEIVETMDHYRKDGQYGRRFDEIEQTYRDHMKNLDKTVSQEARRLRDIYNENRESVGDAARQEAMAAYDMRHKQALDEQVITMKDRISAEVEAERDANIVEMHHDRRRVASQLFDKALTSLLLSTQNEYNQIATTSLVMFDKFRKDHDVLLKKHYQDEILRQSTQAAAILHSNEVAATRQRLENRLDEKQAVIDEADARYRAAQVKFDAERRAALSRQEQDFEKERERDKQEIASLQKTLLEQASSTQSLIDTAVAASESKALLHERQADHYKTEYELSRQREKDARKPSWVMYTAVAVVAIVLGLAIGVAYGISSANVAPGTASKSVGYHAPTGVYADYPTKSYTRAA